MQAAIGQGLGLSDWFAQAEAQMRGGDKLMCKLEVVVEIEGEDRPALTADWLILSARAKSVQSATQSIT